jgi:hypothetical protein
MKTPSTADSRDPSRLPVDSTDDAKRPRRGRTDANVEGRTAPRLPHERDESSDSGTAPPDPLMRQAADDVASGKRATDRGEATDALYARTLRGDKGAPAADPGAAPKGRAGQGGYGTTSTSQIEE